MSTWLYRRLDTFNRARQLAKGAPVISAWALDANGKKTLPLGGVKGVRAGEDDTPSIIPPPPPFGAPPCSAPVSGVLRCQWSRGELSDTPFRTLNS